jgi:hypothetical protein
MLKLTTSKAEITPLTVCKLAFDEGVPIIASEPRLDQPASTVVQVDIKSGSIEEYAVLKGFYTFLRSFLNCLQ